MPRQRYYRSPDRRRERRPPPTAGFLVRDLARLAGVSVPTVKRYVRHGLLAPVPFYGTATRYPHDYLVRVLALRYWRADGSKTLAELRRRMDSVTYAEMQAWVASHPISAETAQALRNDPSTARATHAEHAAPLPHGATPEKSPLETVESSLQLPAENWRRWELMPGLELHLKTDAAPITRNLAARLCRAFAALVGSN